MPYANPPDTCEHQLIFTPALDHAATCARCGAIALIEPHEHQDGAASITWLRAAHETPASNAFTELTTSD